MISLTQYSGQKVGVFGLGKAGAATVAALVRGGAEVFAGDDKCGELASKGSSKLETGNWNPQVSSFEFPVSSFPSWPWPELSCLVLSPGVPLTHPQPHEVVKLARANGVRITGDIELLCEAMPDARKIAITGTNGKSTTTTLIGHILKEAGIQSEVGGNLGTAALSLEALGRDGVYVLETSSYQLDLLERARFDVGVFLNITPDHLDRHGDLEGYIRAKMKMFAHARPEDAAVIAVDDDHTQKIARELAGKLRVVEVSAAGRLKQGVYVADGVLHDTQNDFKLDLRPIATLTGQHNWQNAAAAYAAARLVGVPPENIAKAMQSFAGLKHRLELVGQVRGVRFINDSKATNADATSNALAPYDTIYWIAGGKPKAGGIESLTPWFRHVVHAFLIGAAEEEFAITLEEKIPYTRCGDLRTATIRAADMAFQQGRKGAVVLLSPACASFDQWKSFEERGDAFRAMALAIADEEISEKAGAHGV